MDQLKYESDIELSTETFGTGTPILFLHGFGANRYSWRFLAPDLSKDFRVILVDLMGFGESPKPVGGDYSINEQARLIHQYIIKNELKDLIIIGHSFGGGVALTACIKLMEQNPGLLKKLILIDSIGFKQKLPFFIKILQIPFLGNGSVSLIPRDVQVRITLNHCFYDKQKITNDAVTHYAKNLETPEGQRALIQTAHQIVPKDLDDTIKKYRNLNIPCLLIWGKQDKIVPLEIGKSLNNYLPNSKLEVIDLCGHIPHEEKPDAVLPILKKFLRSGENPKEKLI